MKTFHHLLILLTAFMALVTTAGANEIFTPEELAATVDIRNVETKPAPIHQEQPLVTPELRNQSGRVYVAFIVCKDGAVTGLRCIKSTNNALNTAVMDAVTNWKFKPAQVEGANVAVRIVLPIRVDFS